MLKKKYLKQILWMFGIFTIMGIMLFGAGKEIYAKNQDYIGRIRVGDKPRYSNLDQKGVKEKIYMKKYNKGNITGRTLYINGKAVLKDRQYRGEYDELNVYIIDANKRDNQKEILVLRDPYFMNIKYYRYTSNKLKKVQSFQSIGKKKFKYFNTFHMLTSDAEHGIMFRGKGNGKLSVRCCVNLKNNMGVAEFKDTLILKNRKIELSKKKTFKLLGRSYISENAKDKAVLLSKGINKVYKKPGSSKVVFKLQDKEKFYRKEIYIKNKNTYYLKIKNQNGKTGYVKNGVIKAYEIRGGEQYCVDDWEHMSVDEEE